MEWWCSNWFEVCGMSLDNQLHTVALKQRQAERASHVPKTAIAAKVLNCVPHCSKTIECAFVLLWAIVLSCYLFQETRIYKQFMSNWGTECKNSVYLTSAHQCERLAPGCDCSIRCQITKATEFDSPAFKCTPILNSMISIYIYMYSIHNIYIYGASPMGAHGFRDKQESTVQRMTFQHKNWIATHVVLLSLLGAIILVVQSG